MTQLSSNQLISLRDALQVIPEFDGYNIPIHLFIEGCREAKDLLPENAESNLAKLARIKLKDEAHKSIRGHKFETIAALTQFVWKIYMPAKSILQLLGEIGNSYQNEDENVIAYANRLRDLEIQILLIHEMTNDGITDQDYKASIQRETARCFILGLKSEIWQRMTDISNTDEAMLKAIEIERNLAERLAIRGQAQKNPVHLQSSFEVNRSCQNVNVVQADANTDQNYQKTDYLSQSSNFSQQGCYQNPQNQMYNSRSSECKRKAYKDNQRIQNEQSRNINSLEVNAQTDSSQSQKQCEVLSMIDQKEVEIQVPSLRLQLFHEVTEKSKVLNLCSTDNIEKQEEINDSLVFSESKIEKCKVPFVFSESNELTCASKIEEQETDRMPFVSSELKQLCSDKIKNQGDEKCYVIKDEKDNVSSEFAVSNSKNCYKVDKVENQSQSNQNPGIKKICVSPMLEKRDVIYDYDQNEIERLDKIEELLSLDRANAKGKNYVEKLENEDKFHMSGNDLETKNVLKHQNLINAHQNRLSQSFQGKMNSQVQKCTDESMVQSFVSSYIALNWKTRKKFDVLYCLAL